MYGGIRHRDVIKAGQRPIYEVHALEFSEMPFCHEAAPEPVALNPPIQKQ